MSELKKQAKTIEKELAKNIQIVEELYKKGNMDDRDWWELYGNRHNYYLESIRNLTKVAEELEAENKKLRSELEKDFELLWKEYVECADEKLTTDAQELKQWLLEIVKKKADKQLEARIADVAKFLKTLIELTPIPKKISTYDPETKEDWTIETADPEEYRRLFDFLDENVGRLRAALQKEANGEKQK